MKGNQQSTPIIYDLGERIMAFTTDRSIGREEDKVKTFVARHMKETGYDTGLWEPEALRFARPHQTHSDRILPVAEEFFSLAEGTQKLLMEGVDAVITNVPGIILGVSTADCIPVLVYDHEHHAAAAIHAGWRGSLQRIVMKTLESMRQQYHTTPAMCRAAIGPGISLDSFEVGDEVYNAFAEAAFPMRGVARRYPVMNKSDNETQTEKWHIDLKEINRQQLIAAGITEENISVSDIDTFTDYRFFSARREQTGMEKCGRIFSAFVLGR